MLGVSHEKTCVLPTSLCYLSFRVLLKLSVCCSGFKHQSNKDNSGHKYHEGCDLSLHLVHFCNLKVTVVYVTYTLMLRGKSLVASEPKKKIIDQLVDTFCRF